MKRDEFLKTACALGVCSCAAPGLLARGFRPADLAPDEADELKEKMDFVSRRMAGLVAALDKPTRLRVLEAMGRDCARDSTALTNKFRGNPKGFLEEIKKRWVRETEYDEAAGVIHVIDRSKSCTCPFVKPGLTPPEFCECTLGWQKEAYSAVLGKPVEVELVESILRGGSHCEFRIRVAGG
jgi:predicted hydrocarbon binding protein